ncbi:MAG TPA: hypothetical protein VJK53_05130 [Candidatus Paceibacterota bacterium]
MELHHVLNRGVEKRNIFMNSADYARFVHDLYEFNDPAPAPEYSRRDNVGFTKSHTREPIVDIHGWTLMRNHYHLVLSERVEGGLSFFCRKLNVGYANYFNEKYERSGSLFQGRTKKILIESDAHFLYILHYVHLNPLDYLEGAGAWRHGQIENYERALAHLSSYKWSSYSDYCGRKNFPSVIQTDLFADVFGNYEQTLGRYLKGMRDGKSKRTLDIEGLKFDDWQ